jgi:Protein of unknown function (DUF3307)
MIPLILHLIGDYVTQSDWMAQNKTKRFAPAAAHAVVYSLPFLLLKPSWTAFAVILVTHFLIDRYRLARYVVWLKNAVLQPWGPTTLAMPLTEEEYREKASRARPEEYFYNASLEPRWRYSWKNCSGTGYPSDVPPWLAVWLLIATDNTLHLVINFLALKYL